jgi:hypothetical protein
MRVWAWLSFLRATVRWLSLPSHCVEWLRGGGAAAARGSRACELAASKKS